MNRSVGTRGNGARVTLPFCLAIIWACNSGQVAVAAPAQDGGAQQESPYVGSETCGTCHQNSSASWATTTMGRAFRTHAKEPPEGRGCETCHGPGRAHMEGGGDVNAIITFGKKSKLSTGEQNAVCLKCHERGQRMFWRGSAHQTRGVACVDCHQIMSPNKVSLLASARFNAPLTDVKSTRASQPDLCLSCHQMRRAQLQRSSHMPFREGKVTCSSCHNPHGTPNPKLLIQSTVNENCYSCHSERRGPYLWEHPPVLENCANCHEPHGSTHPQLLRVRAPKLCQQCHNDGQHRSTAYANVMPSAGNRTPAGFNNRVLNRGCANCHSRIHGSNHPSGNYFTR